MSCSFQTDSNSQNALGPVSEAQHFRILAFSCCFLLAVLSAWFRPFMGGSAQSLSFDWQTHLAVKFTENVVVFKCQRNKKVRKISSIYQEYEKATTTCDQQDNDLQTSCCSKWKMKQRLEKKSLNNSSMAAMSTVCGLKSSLWTWSMWKETFSCFDPAVGAPQHPHALTPPPPPYIANTGTISLYALTVFNS